MLPPEPGARGYRLACLCDVHGDLTLSVPPESQAVRNAPRKPYTVTAVEPRPIVTRVCADVPGAYEEPLRPLAERLRSGDRRARSDASRWSCRSPWSPITPPAPISTAPAR